MLVDPSEKHFTCSEKALSTASYLNQDVDGFIGEQITQIITALSGLVNEIYANYDDSWRPGPGRKSRAEQQTNALVACRETVKAFKHFVDLFQYRKFEHRQGPDDLQQCVPSTSRQMWDHGRPGAGAPPIIFQPLLPKLVPNRVPACRPGPSQPAISPPVPLFHSSPPEPKKHSKTDAPSNGYSESKVIKEEPVDIKEEPLDDYGDRPDVKQEEPVADTYCPSSGDARSDLTCREGMSPVSSKPPTRRIVVKGSAKVTKDAVIPMNTNNRPFFVNQLVDSQKDPVARLKEKYADVRGIKRCHLCDAAIKQWCTTPSNEFRRMDFLNRIRTLSTEEWSLIELLKQNDQIRHFCPSHILMADKSGPRAPSPPPKPDPLTAEEKRLQSALTIPKNFKPTFTREYINEHNIQPPPRPPNLSYLNRRCDLCGEVAYPFCLSPKDQHIAPNFFDNLIELTPPQRERVEHYLQKGQRATVCRRHIKPVPVPEGKFVEEVQRFKIGEHQAAKKFDKMRAEAALPYPIVQQRPRKRVLPTEIDVPEMVMVRSNNKRKTQYQAKSAEQTPKLEANGAPVKEEPREPKTEPADEAGPSGVCM